jgi:hypothetical protein
MAHTLEDLEKARHHVAEGQRRVAALIERIAQDRLRGRPTRLAQKSLQAMQDTLVQMRKHLAAIETDLRRLQKHTNVAGRCRRSITGNGYSGGPEKV